jgi:hypothetical protein
MAAARLAKEPAAVSFIGLKQHECRTLSGMAPGLTVSPLPVSCA